MFGVRRNGGSSQHIHSFLEVLPFWVVPLLVLLHEPTTKGWTLRRRTSAFSRTDLAGIAGAILLIGAVPYAEELIRCMRQRLRESRVDDSGSPSAQAPED
jgi:hypothetical protein